MAAIARYYQKAKNGVHALQALIIFIGAAITIALYTKGGQGDGRINYYFVLVSDSHRKAIRKGNVLNHLSAGSVFPLSSTRPRSQSLNEQSASQIHTFTRPLMFFT